MIRPDITLVAIFASIFYLLSGFSLASGEGQTLLAKLVFESEDEAMGEDLNMKAQRIEKESRMRWKIESYNPQFVEKFIAQLFTEEINKGQQPNKNVFQHNNQTEKAVIDNSTDHQFTYKEPEFNQTELSFKEKNDDYPLLDEDCFQDIEISQEPLADGYFDEDCNNELIFS